MDKIDTFRVKKEWSCERWVQMNTNNIDLITGGVSCTRGEYANNNDLHCRAFEKNKDLQNGGEIIFGIFGLFSTKKGVLSFWWVRATRSDGWAEGAKSDKSDTPFMRVRARQSQSNN